MSADKIETVNSDGLSSIGIRHDSRHGLVTCAHTTRLELLVATSKALHCAGHARSYASTYKER